MPEKSITQLFECETRQEFESAYSRLGIKEQREALKRANQTIEGTVEELIGSEKYSHVSATAEAMETAHAAVGEFQKLTNTAKLGSYEIGFFLIGNCASPEVITEVYIPDTQVVTPAHCDIDGASKANAHRYARRNGGALRSWAHSHASFGVGLSGEDRDTLERNVSDFPGVVQEKVFVNGKPLPYRIKVNPTFVINTHGSEYGAIQFSYPVLNQSRNTNSVNVSRKVRVVGSLPVKRVQDNGAADITLRSRIRRLLMYGQNNNGGTILEAGRGQARLADLVNPRALAEMAEDDLQQAAILYSTLEQKCAALTEAQKSAQSQLTDEKAKFYRRTMQLFYAPLMRSKSRVANVVGVIAKIMAGEYMGTVEAIKGGSIEEDTQATKIWEWNDRIKAVRAVFRQNQGLIHDNRDLLKPVLEMVMNNAYATDNHPDDLRKLRRYLVR